MKTDELIHLLATGAEAVETHAAERRFALALAAGALGAVALMLSLMRLRADLAEAVLLPMFWLKIGFVASLLVASLFAALRLSRPGARLIAVPGVLTAPILLMWMIAVQALMGTEPAQRVGLILGATWRSCPALIALISIPVFITAMLAMKSLAPTRPRLAGFAVGLLSGATAALAYCLHCPEMAAPFIGLWYLLGMLIPALAGAAMGERLLRW